MKRSLENQAMQTVEELRAQLKGVIPPRLSKEERLELVEWLKKYKKTVPPYFLEEYRKHVQEISRPPNRICGN